MVLLLLMLTSLSIQLGCKAFPFLTFDIQKKKMNWHTITGNVCLSWDHLIMLILMDVVYLNAWPIRHLWVNYAWIDKVRDKEETNFNLVYTSFILSSHWRATSNGSLWFHVRNSGSWWTQYWDAFALCIQDLWKVSSCTSEKKCPIKVILA